MEKTLNDTYEMGTSSLEIVESNINNNNNNNNFTNLNTNYKVNLDDIKKKKLEINLLNKLPESKLLLLDNNIEYTSPLSALPLQSSTATKFQLPAINNGTKTENTVLKTTNDNLIVESDFEKIDCNPVYSRPPPSAPRKSLESKTSTTSMQAAAMHHYNNQYEQQNQHFHHNQHYYQHHHHHQMQQNHQASNQIYYQKDTCSCTYHRYNPTIPENATIASNDRIIQSTEIAPGVTRIYIRTIDPNEYTQANDQQRLSNHANNNSDENAMNKKWNDYYDNIKMNENYFVNSRKQFFEGKPDINENDYQNQQQLTAENNHKAMCCNEVRNKRIERLKQEDIICNHLVMDRVCSNSNLNRNVQHRDQECQFPTPCVRCIQKKKSTKCPSPLIEEINFNDNNKYQTTETQTYEVEMQEMNKLQVKPVIQKELQFKALKHHAINTTPCLTANLKAHKKDEFYQFLTPSYNGDMQANQNHKFEPIDANKLMKHDIGHDSSTPSVNTNSSSGNNNNNKHDKEIECELISTSQTTSIADKATNTIGNMFFESKTAQCPSPSHKKIASDKQCQYPTLNFKQQYQQTTTVIIPPPPPPPSHTHTTATMTASEPKSAGLKRILVTDENEMIVDFNNKNSQAYRKFINRTERNSTNEEIPLKTIENENEQKQLRIKFSDVKYDHCGKNEHKPPDVRNNKVPIILPSKQLQTFYNGDRVWQTPRDLIIVANDKYLLL